MESIFRTLTGCFEAQLSIRVEKSKQDFDREVEA